MIVDLTSESPAPSPQRILASNANSNRSTNENDTDDENEESSLIQLFRIEAKIVGKRFYKEKLNDGELVYLGNNIIIKLYTSIAINESFIHNIYMFIFLFYIII